MLRKYSWLAILLLLGFLLARAVSPALGFAFGPQHLPFSVPEFPPLLRFSGFLLLPPPQENEKEEEESTIRPLIVTIGQEKWNFRLQEVKALSGGPNGPLVLSQVFPRQLRFIGPEKFLHQIEDSAKAGKFVVIEGHLYMGAYKFRVTSVGERPDWDIHPGFFDPYQGTKALEKHQQVTRMLHEAGGLIVGGTDCGALAYPPPGFALLREIELLADAIGTMAALKAVTSVAARYLRQQDTIGTIAPGRYADFLVIEGDPLRDVRDLRKLATVYRGGIAHDPQALLGQVPKSDFVPLS